MLNVDVNVKMAQSQTEWNSIPGSEMTAVDSDWTIMDLEDARRVTSLGPDLPKKLLGRILSLS